jgi:hypothetical protein
MTDAAVTQGTAIRGPKPRPLQERIEKLFYANSGMWMLDMDGFVSGLDEIWEDNRKKSHYKCP